MFTALYLLVIRDQTLLKISHYLLPIYKATILIIMADILIEVIIKMPTDEVVILQINAMDMCKT